MPANETNSNVTAAEGENATDTDVASDADAILDIDFNNTNGTNGTNGTKGPKMVSVKVEKERKRLHYTTLKVQHLPPPLSPGMPSKASLMSPRQHC